MNECFQSNFFLWPMWLLLIKLGKNREVDIMHCKRYILYILLSATDILLLFIFSEFTYQKYEKY